MKRWDKGSELRITVRLSLRLFFFFLPSWIPHLSMHLEKSRRLTVLRTIWNCSSLWLALPTAGARSLPWEPFYWKYIYTGKGWLQGLAWEMEAPFDGLLRTSVNQVSTRRNEATLILNSALQLLLISFKVYIIMENKYQNYYWRL